MRNDSKSWWCPKIKSWYCKKKNLLSNSGVSVNPLIKLYTNDTLNADVYQLEIGYLNEYCNEIKISYKIYFGF